MTIYGSTLPGAASIAHWGSRVERLTPEAKRRLTVIDWHPIHSKNISFTARHFGWSRTTVRKWVRRFHQNGILGFIDHSRRPRFVRRPTTAWTVVAAIVRIRRERPAWSKMKIAEMLKRDENIVVSPSTIGRVMKRKGLINARTSRKRQRAAMRPKARFPHGMKICAPGDLIQIDTKHLPLIGGGALYQFTAIDVLTKVRVLRIYSSQSSRNGSRFLEECIANFPFLIRMIQTDNGAPFQKEFEQMCMQRKIPHVFIYPRSPKQNTYVEISHGADEREFYQQGKLRQDKDAMTKELRSWETTWNTIRPHQALNYLTPMAFLERWKLGILPTKSVITLQT